MLCTTTVAKFLRFVLVLDQSDPTSSISQMERDTTLFVVTYLDGRVVSGVDGQTATELFEKAQNTDCTCTVTYLKSSYNKP